MAPGYTYQLLINQKGLIPVITITNDPSDSKQLIPLLEKLKEIMPLKSLKVMTDNAYHNLINLSYSKKRML